MSMARHRTLHTRVQRGIAHWPVLVIAAVALLLLGWVGYTWVGGVLERRVAAEAGGCSQGDAAVHVAAAPSVAEAVQRAAGAWNRQRPVVFDHCVHVEVQSIDPETTLAGLTQSWDEARLGPRPQAWLPDSTLWVNRLTAQNAGLVGAPPQSLATSPVVLAVPEPAEQALLGGNGFTWSDLPGLAAAPDGWSRYGKPEWGRFTVAVPEPAGNPASALAIQSALAGTTAQGAGPVTAAQLAEQPAKDTLAKLATAQPAKVPATTDDALAALGKVDTPAAGAFGAVPVFEVDLYRHNTGKDGAPAGRPLSGVTAGGPTPAADFPFLSLAGNWADEAQQRAAQQFRDFLTSPAQRQVLAESGLRVAGSTDHPNPSPGIRWAPVPQALAPADAATSQQLTAAWTASLPPPQSGR
jgi:Ca-activated chloride channel family protein